MRVCYVMSINRALPVEEAKDNIDLFIKLREENEDYKKLIVGIELSGLP